MAKVMPLESQGGRELLDAIDQLRSLPNITHDIDLPQIVVVGQQSSGKSTVLKAISNIDFPTDDGLGTQFATEIICRREMNSKTEVSIIPSDPIETRDALYRRRHSEFSQRWSVLESIQDISGVITDAKHVMGLDEHTKISKDKLRLVFAGPDQVHISLVDLPGLFEQPRQHQREEDRVLVDEMVIDYISREQSIILAVVSGGNDLENQRIPKVFRPYNERVIGVITQPDNIAANTARARVFQRLVANAEFKTGHGWHVLRSLSLAEQEEGLDRDVVETDFFARRFESPENPWKDVPDSRVGIESLKLKLVGLLQRSISEAIPKIRQKLHTALQHCEDQLALLGDERSTCEQQRKYLATKSEKLRKRTAEELSGGNGQRTLRSKIRNQTDRFADRMATHGATWDFKIGPATPGCNLSFDACPDIEVAPIKVTHTDWLEFMKSEIANCQGRELSGLIDHIWVGRMFTRQSRKWVGLTEMHANETYDIVKEYFEEVVEQVVGIESAARFLEFAIYPELERRLKALKDKVKELLSPYRTEHIQTSNREFRRRNADDSPFLMEITDSVSRETSRMVEYYSVALNVFVDNIESLAIENVLLGQLEEIMNADQAYNMTEAKLADLAAEPEDVSLNRQRLMIRIKEYKQGCQTISQLNARHGRSIRVPTRPPRPLQAAPISPAAAPRIVVAPVPEPGTERIETHNQQIDSPNSSDTVCGGEPVDRQGRQPSTGPSSRASSVSRIFSEDGNEAEGTSSGASSANPTPSKSPGSNLFAMSVSPSRSKSKQSKQDKSPASNSKDGTGSSFGGGARHSFGQPQPSNTGGLFGQSQTTGFGSGSGYTFGASVASKSDFGTGSEPRTSAPSLFGSVSQSQGSPSYSF